MDRVVVLGIYVFLLAIFVGFEVIARVPSILHTPLMSATNAIHGIVLLGAMLVAGAADTPLLHALGFVEQASHLLVQPLRKSRAGRGLSAPERHIAETTTKGRVTVPVPVQRPRAVPSVAPPPTICAVP